jgi:hypothetical protein
MKKKEKVTASIDFHLDKMRGIGRFRDTLRPEKCFDCRFLYYWSPPKKGGWCVIWREDKDWKAESCQSGIKKFTRDNILEGVKHEGRLRNRS